VCRLLKEEEFTETWLRVPKGEKYSLVRRLIEPWELHVRIYESGFIESEVEVSRDYIEHLGEYRVYVVYELFNFYSKVYDRLHILYKPRNRWVVKVWDNLRIRVKPPKLLTPWKPIAVGVGVAIAVGLLTYALAKLEKGDHEHSQETT